MLHIIAWLVIGGIVGAIAGRVMSGHGYGIVVDVILGLVGGLIGGYIIRALMGPTASASLILQVIAAFVVACILVGIVHMVRREPLRT